MFHTPRLCAPFRAGCSTSLRRASTGALTKHSRHKPTVSIVVGERDATWINNPCNFFSSREGAFFHACFPGLCESCRVLGEIPSARSAESQSATADIFQRRGALNVQTAHWWCDHCGRAKGDRHPWCGQCGAWFHTQPCLTHVVHRGACYRQACGSGGNSFTRPTVRA